MAPPSVLQPSFTYKLSFWFTLMSFSSGLEVPSLLQVFSPSSVSPSPPHPHWSSDSSSPLGFIPSPWRSLSHDLPYKISLPWPHFPLAPVLLLFAFFLFLSFFLSKPLLTTQLTELWILFFRSNESLLGKWFTFSLNLLFLQYLPFHCHLAI